MAEVIPEGFFFKLFFSCRDLDYLFFLFRSVIRIGWLECDEWIVLMRFGVVDV